MLELVRNYTSTTPDNILAQYIGALEAVNGTDSHDGLDPTFVPVWNTAATDLAFQDAQDHERDEIYFNPAVAQGKSDGLGTLGQFIYYDALVMHGPGEQHEAFGGMRLAAMENARRRHRVATGQLISPPFSMFATR